MRIRNALTHGFPAGSFRYRFDSDRLLLKWQARCIRLPFLFCRGGDQGLFVRKEAFDAAGGYKSHFVVMEDYDLIRTLRKQARFALLPDEAIVSARKYRHNAWLKVQSRQCPGHGYVFKWVVLTTPYPQYLFRLTQTSKSRIGILYLCAHVCG